MHLLYVKEDPHPHPVGGLLNLSPYLIVLINQCNDFSTFYLLDFQPIGIPFMKDCSLVFATVLSKQRPIGNNFQINNQMKTLYSH